MYLFILNVQLTDEDPNHSDSTESALADEDPIETCERNLVQHILRIQAEISRRMDLIEEQINGENSTCSLNVELQSMNLILSFLWANSKEKLVSDIVFLIFQESRIWQFAWKIFQNVVCWNSAASDLDLHCLPITHLGVSRLQ